MPVDVKLNILAWDVLVRLADIIRMINTSIKSNKVKIENLYKSIFSDGPTTDFIFEESYVAIQHLDSSNSDPALLEINENNDGYRVSYWDGYSLAEVVEEPDISKALKTFKRLAKKLGKNLKNYNF